MPKQHMTIDDWRFQDACVSTDLAIPPDCNRTECTTPSRLWSIMLERRLPSDLFARRRLRKAHVTSYHHKPRRIGRGDDFCLATEEIFSRERRDDPVSTEMCVGDSGWRGSTSKTALALATVACHSRLRHDIFVVTRYRTTWYRLPGLNMSGYPPPPFSGNGLPLMASKTNASVIPFLGSFNFNGLLDRAGPAMVWESV